MTKKYICSVVLFFFLIATAKAQLQFGAGYGAGYLYSGLNNLEASLVELNYVDKPWYDDKVGVVRYAHGIHVEAVGLNIPMLVSFTLVKNKTHGGGIDPTTNDREDYELRHTNGRIGFGMKVGKNRTALGITFQVGFSGYKYMITGNNSTQVEWEEHQRCISYGSVVAWEYFLKPRLGLQFQWYLQWVSMETLFVVNDYRYKYSTIGASLILYARKNYEN